MLCPTCPFFPFSYFVYSYAHRMLCCHDQLSPVEDDGKRLINFLSIIFVHAILYGGFLERIIDESRREINWSCIPFAQNCPIADCICESCFASLKPSFMYNSSFLQFSLYTFIKRSRNFGFAEQCFRSSFHFIRATNFIFSSFFPRFFPFKLLCLYIVSFFVKLHFILLAWRIVRDL